MSKFENPIQVSVGNIESVRVNKNGRVKYEISYLDRKGNTHTAWSDWMQDNNYQAGCSIPVQTLSLPGACKLYTPLLEVNGVLQRRIEPQIAALALVGIGMGVVGYILGKESK